MNARIDDRKVGVWGGCLAIAALGALFGQTSADANQFVRLDYSIELGGRARDTVFIELFDDKPITRDNFMAYVNSGKYDGMLMHRLSRNFVIQGGGYYPEYQAEPSIPSFPWSLKSSTEVQLDLDGNPATPNPEIVNEYSVGTIRSNVRGTLGMARRGGQPNSASSQWFVNYGNNSFLDSVDGGMTVFAELRGDGMSYFDALNVLKTLAQPDGVELRNLNQDTNDDGIREAGPFSVNANDAVPLWKGERENLVVVQDAQRVDYFGGAGSSSTLHFPEAGVTLSARPAFFDAGVVFTGTGGLTIGAGNSLGVREGVALERSVTNLGTFEPGLQIGQATVQSYQQAASGTLAIDLFGTVADSQYDQVLVNEIAQLDGKLQVSLLNGFQPSAGDSFAVVSAGSIIGDFSDYELPPLPMDLSWVVARDETAITLSVVAVPEPRLLGLLTLPMLLSAIVRNRR